MSAETFLPFHRLESVSSALGDTLAKTFNIKGRQTETLLQKSTTEDLFSFIGRYTDGNR
jgi:hypothetical protein